MTKVSIQSSPVTTDRYTVNGLTPKQVAELIASACDQDAIWKGKAISEWHITDKHTRKVSAIVY